MELYINSATLLSTIIGLTHIPALMTFKCIQMCNQNIITVKLECQKNKKC